jgi:hypothetical protein
MIQHAWEKVVEVQVEGLSNDLVHNCIADIDSHSYILSDLIAPIAWGNNFLVNLLTRPGGPALTRVGVSAVS